eukprot:TRINITY_DN580_c0_g1_i4.p1 TRINITY_DN580_c0_g1~~TRINITY_DN580_c0_g1_i4.p1  ORF type:complete len:318 (+),score=89.01 TRINITY_DN580_c0_g1_i4:281-1234(+)
MDPTSLAAKPQRADAAEEDDDGNHLEGEGEGEGEGSFPPPSLQDRRVHEGIHRESGLECRRGCNQGFFHGCRIKSIKFVHDKETQKFKGCGHVEFEDDESLEVAMTLDQKHLLGRPMKVAYAVTGSFRKVQGGGPVSEKRKVSGPVPTEAAAGSFGTITGRVSDSRSEGKKIRMESQNMREGIAAAAADADNATSLGGDPTTKVSEELQDLGNGSSISNTRKSKPRQGQIAAAAGRNESNGWEKHSNDEANEGADGLVHGDAIGAEGTGGDEEDGGKRRRRGGRGKKNVCCHSCGGTGHKSFDCPSGNSGGGEGEGG